MEEGKLYILKTTGGLHECQHIVEGVAIMKRVTQGYEGKDPKRSATFLDEEWRNWELADDSALDAQIWQNNKAIQNAEETIAFWQNTIDEFVANSAYIRSKKSDEM